MPALLPSSSSLVHDTIGLQFTLLGGADDCVEEAVAGEPSAATL